MGGAARGICARARSHSEDGDPGNILLAHDTRVRVIGDLSLLPVHLRDAADAVMRKTAHCNG